MIPPKTTITTVKSTQPPRGSQPSDMDGTSQGTPPSTGTFTAAIPVSAKGDAEAVLKLLNRYAATTPAEAMTQLARHAGLTKPHEIAAFVHDLKLTTVYIDVAGEELPPRTPEERKVLEDLGKKVDQHAAAAPKNATLRAQFCNQVGTAAPATLLGFGLVTVIGKVGTYALLPTPYYLATLGGAIVMFGGESVAGTIGASGAGYAGVDAKAYADFNTCMATLASLEIKERGLDPLDSKTEGKKNKIEHLCRDEFVKMQRICVDLMKRELGKPLGMKGDTDNDDVPRRALVHSKLTCQREEAPISAASVTEDEDETRIDFDNRPEMRVRENEDDKPAIHEGQCRHEIYHAQDEFIFTVEPGATSASFKVTWPGDKEPMDLCKTAVPVEFIPRFKELADKLVSAARWRSFVCDELPYELYSCTLLLPGALTPILQGTMSGAALAATDTVQSFFLNYGGISSMSIFRNALRSRFSGANPSPGTYGPAQDAKYDAIQFQLAGVDARAEFVRDLKKAMTTGLEDLRAQRGKLVKRDQYPEFDAKELSDEDSKELENIEKNIALHEHALSDVRELRRLCVKERNSLVAQREAVDGIAKAAGRGWVDGLKGYFCRNRPQALAKLVSYSVPFALYSCLYANYVVAPLVPLKTVLDKATGLLVAPRFGPLWVPYTMANAFYGFVIGQPYMARNLIGTTYLERGLAQAGEYARQGLESTRRGLSAAGAVAQQAYEVLVENYTANYRASGIRIVTDVSPRSESDKSVGEPATQASASTQRAAPHVVIDIEPKEASRPAKSSQREKQSGDVINLYPDSDDSDEEA